MSLIDYAQKYKLARERVSSAFHFAIATKIVFIAGQLGPDGVMVRESASVASRAGGRGFDRGPRHTKDVM